MKSSTVLKLVPKTELEKELGPRPLLLYPDVAKTLGVTNAICWQQVKYCIENNPGIIHDEKKWICSTYEQWQEQLPFFSIQTIKRSFHYLEMRHIVLSFINKGNIKYYTLEYETLYDLLDWEREGVFR